MPMPNRQIVNGEPYRYAFQGQEIDPETGKEAFQLRLWDGRVGRWLTTDPYGQYASPYLGMGNNPINGTDPDGGKFNDEWDVDANGDMTWVSHAGGDEVQYFNFKGGDLDGQTGIALGNFDRSITNFADLSGSNLNLVDMLSTDIVSNFIGGSGKYPSEYWNDTKTPSVVSWYTNPSAGVGSNGGIKTQPITGQSIVFGEKGIEENNILFDVMLGAGLSKAVGPLKHWLRLGTGRNLAKETTVRFAWGAGRNKYLRQIGSNKLRVFNKALRKMRGGHLHLYKTKGFKSWIPKGW
jgi:RHS repeat-associated protein